jgi:hypothetical protein
MCDNYFNSFFFIKIGHLQKSSLLLYFFQGKKIDFEAWWFSTVNFHGQFLQAKSLKFQYFF